MVKLNIPKVNLLKSNVAPLPKKVKDKVRKKTRKISHKGLVRKLDDLFSKYIRKRDVFTQNSIGVTICKCCTCEQFKIDENGDIHAGHFQKRGKWNTRYDERNVNAQCKACNTFKGGRDFEYGLYIDNKYGKGTAEALYIKAKIPKKYMRVELEEMIKHYQEKLNG